MYLVYYNIKWFDTRRDTIQCLELLTITDNTNHSSSSREGYTKTHNLLAVEKCSLDTHLINKGIYIIEFILQYTAVHCKYATHLCGKSLSYSNLTSRSAEGLLIEQLCSTAHSTMLAALTSDNVKAYP